MYVVVTSLYYRYTGSKSFGIMGVYTSLENAWTEIEHALEYETSPDRDEPHDIVAVDIYTLSCLVDLTYKKQLDIDTMMYYREWQIVPIECDLFKKESYKCLT